MPEYTRQGWITMSKIKKNIKSFYLVRLFQKMSTMKVRLLGFTLILSLCALLANAQSGEIQGKIIDEQTGEAIPFANIVVQQDGSQIMGGLTDFDGFYSLKPLSPGTYSVIVSYQGKNKEIQGVQVNSDKSTFLDINLNSAVQIDEVFVWDKPLIDPDNTTQGQSMSKEEIQRLPTRTIGGIASLAAGVGGASGGGLSIRGSRGNATLVMVDGVPVRGSSNIPQNAIEQAEVITGGIPAKYGDVTGGVISITTKGPSSKFRGGFQGLTSQFLDPYNYNLANVSLSGPLLFKDKDSDEKKPLLGFSVTAEYLYQRDPNPNPIGAWKAKDEVAEDLLENPLTESPTGTGVALRGDFLRQEDAELMKYNPNTPSNRFTLASRFNVAVSDQVNIAFGGSWDYVNSRRYIKSYTLLNSQNNFQDIANTVRGWARFTQNFKQETGGEEESSASYLKNAYYSVQVSYEKFNQLSQGAKHKNNLFDVGYVGHFDILSAPNYDYGEDTIAGTHAYRYRGEQITDIIFTPSDLNPELAAYTEYADPTIQALFDAGVPASLDFYANPAFGGIRNGDIPLGGGRVYSLWDVGNPANGYALTNNDQFRLRVDGSVDIQKPGSEDRNKHAIEFGLQYEQRVERFYTIGPRNLWNVMRQSVNRHLADLDESNPQLVYDENGVFQDTINYNYLIDLEQQSLFDKNLREALGLPIDQIVYVDEYAPETFSLDMFGADQLLTNLYSSGGGAINYYGYDFKGERNKSQPTLDDYFNEVDENGYSLRGAAAFSPIYTAAYIQDRFNFKDITARAGVRIDRYDANQPVPNDLYSLYNIQTVGEVGEVNGVSVTHPGNVGDGYKVYVNDLSNPTEIVGYRNGDVWYDAEGNELLSSDVLKDQSTSGQVTPYLVDYENADNLELDASSFKDYEPEVNIMPRLAFSFPISDVALFFAHYDVLVQRPLAGASRFIPMQYAFLEQSQGALINNPALRPERTISYELGFTQALNLSSVLTVSAYYREIRDQVQVIPVKNAYPVNYLTFGNIDFGTVKGLTFTYELRKTKNLSATANYTIQFANGTGLGPTSGANLASATFNSTQDLLRTILPTNEDNRHRINLSVDYRYGAGKDYNGPTWKIKDKYILENTGINLRMLTFSGSPYTPRSNATTIQSGVADRSSISGGINSGRLPWIFRLDGSINKQFALVVNQANNKSLACNAYLQVSNILNTINIGGVYGYTGSPEDDGYLAAQRVQSIIAAQNDAQSFRDLYNMALLNPGFYGGPRTIRLGLNVSF